MEMGSFGGRVRHNNMTHMKMRNEGEGEPNGRVLGRLRHNNVKLKQGRRMRAERGIRKDIRRKDKAQKHEINGNGK
jgi:hypothetical protein